REKPKRKPALIVGRRHGITVLRHRLRCNDIRDGELGSRHTRRFGTILLARGARASLPDVLTMRLPGVAVVIGNETAVDLVPSALEQAHTDALVVTSFDLDDVVDGLPVPAVALGMHRPGGDPKRLVDRLHALGVFVAEELDTNLRLEVVYDRILVLKP